MSPIFYRHRGEFRPGILCELGCDTEPTTVADKALEKSASQIAANDTLGLRSQRLAPFPSSFFSEIRRERVLSVARVPEANVCAGEWAASKATRPRAPRTSTLNTKS